MQRLALLLETCENLAYISGIKKGYRFVLCIVIMKQIAFLSVKVGMFKGP